MPSLDSSLLAAAVAGTVTQVFESILDTTAEPTDYVAPPRGELVTAILYFGGGWAGTALLQLPPDLARVFASRLLGIDALACADDDVIDAMGELVNLIGGNLKAVLPRGVDLSLPTVVSGGSYAIRVCGGQPVDRWTFGSELGPFWVSLMEEGRRPSSLS